jgi:hypothetical protein
MESGRGGTYATVTRMSTSAAATTYEVSSMAEELQYSTAQCGTYVEFASYNLVWP